MLGQYGASPAPVNEEARKAIAGDAQPITGRPADELKPELEAAAQEAGSRATCDEDIASYVQFPQVAREFLEWRAGGAGIENEIVAALAAALAHDRKPADAPAAPGGGRPRGPGGGGGGPKGGRGGGGGPPPGPAGGRPRARPSGPPRRAALARSRPR